MYFFYLDSLCIIQNAHAQPSVTGEDLWK